MEPQPGKLCCTKVGCIIHLSVSMAYEGYHVTGNDMDYPAGQSMQCNDPASYRVPDIRSGPQERQTTEHQDQIKTKSAIHGPSLCFCIDADRSDAAERAGSGPACRDYGVKSQISTGLFSLLVI